MILTVFIIVLTLFLSQMLTFLIMCASTYISFTLWAWSEFFGCCWISGDLVKKFLGMKCVRSGSPPTPKTPLLTNYPWWKYLGANGFFFCFSRSFVDRHNYPKFWALRKTKICLRLHLGGTRERYQKFDWGAKFFLGLRNFRTADWP